VSFGAGVVLKVRPGDAVRAGDPLLELRTDEPGRIPAAREVAAPAIVVAETAPDPAPLLIDRIA
jgi:thymidine phosphorylase